MIRVDNATYTWMGDPGPQPVTQVGFEYTSTKSIFTMEVDNKVKMEIMFLSPIRPYDEKAQSLTSSYLEVTVESLDGLDHDFQLYSDISAGKTFFITCCILANSATEWVSGDRASVAQWEYSHNIWDVDVAYHRVYRQTHLHFSETSDQADWGYWYWATQNVLGLTFQSGADKVVRDAFQSKGKLADTTDTNFWPINEDFPVFGSIVSPMRTLFALNLMQEQAIRFEGQNGNITLNSLWTSYFPDETTAVSRECPVGRQC